MMTCQNMALADAFDYVKSCRFIGPNPGFWDQLQDYEDVVSKAHEDLLRKYPNKLSADTEYMAGFYEGLSQRQKQEQVEQIEEEQDTVGKTQGGGFVNPSLTRS